MSDIINLKNSNTHFKFYKMMNFYIREGNDIRVFLKQYSKKKCVAGIKLNIHIHTTFSGRINYNILMVNVSV